MELNWVLKIGATKKVVNILLTNTPFHGQPVAMLKGVIPPSLKIDHVGRLSYFEDQAVESFLTYAGKVHEEIKQGDLYLEGQAHAMARLIFLLEPEVRNKIINLVTDGAQELESLA